jgi:SAM-dependent methyltransferase
MVRSVGTVLTDDGGSPERFAYEWATYSEVAERYEEQFRRWTPHFTQHEWRDKHFLDVGCGMGRNSYWPMKYGARGGLAIDIVPLSVEVSRRNLAQFESMEVGLCSAYDIDRVDEFDIVFSIGVIHHLEFPDQALARMVAAARPGGKVAIWVYGRENNGWLLWALEPARKLLFSRLPIGLLHFLSLLPTALLWLPLRLGLGRSEYFRLIRTFSFSHLRSIVFDQLLPRIANYWRREEVEALMKKAGLEEIELVWVNEMSWAACGKKPSQMRD